MMTKTKRRIRNNKKIPLKKAVNSYVRSRLKNIIEQNKEETYNELLEGYKNCFRPVKVSDKEKSYLLTPYAKIKIDADAKKIIKCVKNICLRYEKEWKKIINSEIKTLVNFDETDTFPTKDIIKTSSEFLKEALPAFRKDSLFCTGKDTSDYYENLDDAVSHVQGIIDDISECFLTHKDRKLKHITQRYILSNSVFIYSYLTERFKSLSVGLIDV